MDFSTSALSSRAMSAFPISIGTSLALESIFAPMQAPYDPERPIPQKVNISSYDSLWVNLMTLYRNIIGALEKGGDERVMAGDLSDTMEFEVDLIKRLVQEATFGKTRVVFYASSYKDLARHHPHAKLREATTDKQKQYQHLMELTLNTFVKGQVKSDSIELFDRKLKPKRRDKTLIMTNYAYDLLSHPEFESLDLIESHTGVLKGRGLWYTKFSNSKELMRIPFNVAFLQVFGDSQTFAAMPIKLREQVMALADQYNWHAFTTKDRLLLGFADMPDKFAGMTLKQMLSE